jgi:hypothetical protein
MSRYDILFQKQTIARGQTVVDGGELSHDTTAIPPREIDVLIDTAQLVKSLVESVGKEMPYGIGLDISFVALGKDIIKLINLYPNVTPDIILKLAADVADIIPSIPYTVITAFPELEMALYMLAFALSAAAMVMEISVDISEHTEICAWEDDVQEIHFQALAAKGRTLAQSAPSAGFQSMVNMVN